MVSPTPRDEEIIMPTIMPFRARVALALPVAEALLLAFVLLVVQKMTNNPNFASTGTVVSDLAAAAAAFQAAKQTMSKVKGANQARGAAKQAMLDALRHVQDYVNGVVEKLPPDQGVAVIESAGFRAKKRSTYAKPALAVRYAGLLGSVTIAARSAGRNAIYYFEYSSDGKSWVACPVSFKSKTTVSGLAVGTIYSFRFHAQTPKGPVNLSDVVTFTVR
jgi:hypothetical protein